MRRKANINGFLSIRQLSLITLFWSLFLSLTTFAQQEQKMEAMQAVMMGEIAWDRGHYNEALNYYIGALGAYPDKQLASRATEIALMADSLEFALFTSSQWSALDPKNLNAHAIYITLLCKSEDVDTMLSPLTFLHNIDEEHFIQGVLLVSSQLHNDKEKNILYKAVSKFTALHPTERASHYAEAFTAYLAGQKDVAFNTVQTLISQKPLWTPAVSLYIQFLDESNEAQKALDYLASLYKQQTNNSDIGFIYAKMLSEYKHYSEAKPIFDTYLKNKTYQQDAKLYLGVIDFEQHNYKEAEKYLNDIVGQESSNDTALYYLGQVNERNGKLEQALSYYEQVESGQYFVNAQTCISIITAKQGDLSTALSRLNGLILNFPEYKKQLTLTSIHLLSQAKQAKSALKLLNHAVANNPKDTDYLYARSLVAAKLNDLKTAEKDLVQVISLQPNHIDALNALGFTLADKTKRYDEAMNYIQKAMAIEPNNPSIIDSFGWVLYRQGKYQESVSQLRLALDLSHDGEIAAHLGEVLWVSGNSSEAMKVWQSALIENPETEAIITVMHKFKVDVSKATVTP